MNLSLPIESVGIKATEHRKYSESQKDAIPTSLHPRSCSTCHCQHSKCHCHFHFGMEYIRVNLDFGCDI